MRCSAARAAQQRRRSDWPIGDDLALIFDTHYPRLFGIPAAHSLELDHERQASRAGVQRHTRWFVEHDGALRIVARYRTWTSIGTRAPYRRQLGWERYSPSGELQVREVRYGQGSGGEPDASVRWLN